MFFLLLLHTVRIFEVAIDAKFDLREEKRKEKDRNSFDFHF